MQNIRWNFLRPWRVFGRTIKEQFSWPPHPPRLRKASATNGTTPADIEKQLETIRDDISELTQQVADLDRPDKGRRNGSGENSGPARQGAGEFGALGRDRRPAARRSTRSATWPTRSATRSRIRSSAGPTRRSRWSPASASCSAPPGGAERAQGGNRVRQPLGPAAGRSTGSRSPALICYAVARHRRRDRAAFVARRALHLGFEQLWLDHGQPARWRRFFVVRRGHCRSPCCSMRAARREERRSRAEQERREGATRPQGSAPPTLARSGLHAALLLGTQPRRSQIGVRHRGVLLALSSARSAR